MKWLAVVVALVAAAAVAVAFGPRWVLGPLAGYLIYRAGTSMLRGMAAGAGTTPDEPEPMVGKPERVLYWCEQCGAELLLVVRGSDRPPRHCGERMHERVELARP